MLSIFINSDVNQQNLRKSDTPLAEEIVHETKRTWDSYRKYAWGHDVLAPLSKSFKDWYEEPLYISPIDAYSTLFIMGLRREAAEIEEYVVHNLDFDKNLDAKIFEVNIRILGGLLSMYEMSANERILEKARDFADRMLPAFDTPTGIPRFWVNLKTGESRGSQVNTAEAASYVFEMGILSYYTRNPKYYQAAKKATRAVFSRRFDLDLVGEMINVESGEWLSPHSHICAGVDSYYEYLLKSALLLGDEELHRMWDVSIKAIQQYLREWFEDHLWYARVDMNTGERVSSVVTLYDAFFPAVMALSGDIGNAAEYEKTWNWLWSQYELEPMIYDYKSRSLNHPVYDLNPEIMESAYYLYSISGDLEYHRMNERFWKDIKKHCRTEVGFTSIENVVTKKSKDTMPTFFFAETLKYLYLTFSQSDHGCQFGDVIFSTEAHPFQRKNFDHGKARETLGF